MMQSWFSAQDIADLVKRTGFKHFPSSKRRIQDFAKREEWAAHGDLCRRRKVRGGGLEYHISLLPEMLQDVALAEHNKQIIKQDQQVSREREARRRAALVTTELSARQRQVMDARAAILSAIDTYQLHEELSRFQAIKCFLVMPAEFGIDEQTAITANDRTNKSAKLSRSSIYRWYNQRDDFGVAALAPLKTKKKQSFPDWFGGFLHHYARPQKPCISEALREFQRELKNKGSDFVPTYAQVVRLLRQMDDISKHKGRERPLTLKARMAYVSRSIDGMLPTTIYTADGKTFDAEVAHPITGSPFKPEITSVVDVATRKCVGFSIGLVENADGVIDALRNSIETHGIPAIFYTDRGPGYKNKRLKDQMTGVLERLGITSHHSLPRNSQARGVIERFNGTVWNPLAREYATYLGREMDKEASNFVHKRTRKDLKEFGESKLLKSWDEFMADCKRAIDEYNARIHRKLRCSPNEAWARHVDQGFQPVTLVGNEGDDLFRSYVVRTVSRCIVRFINSEYFSLDLDTYHNKKVIAGFDIHDGSKLWIREIEEIDGQERPGKLICIAERDGHTRDYVNENYAKVADEKRAKARKRRLDVKYDEIDAELNPVPFIEASNIQPMEPLTPPANASITIEQSSENIDRKEGLRADNVRPLRFASDEDLAIWALEHPNGLASSQIEVLRNCLLSQAKLELLEMSGIDVNRLREIVRAAA